MKIFPSYFYKLDSGITHLYSQETNKNPQKVKSAPEKRLNVRVPADLYERFQKIITARGQTISFVISRYMKEVVDADEIMNE